VRVDTHLEVHAAAALDERGGLLGTASFATTPAGYRELVEWFASLGALVLIGVEGTGSYGAGLTRHLQDLGIAVVEDRIGNGGAGKGSPIRMTRSARHEPRSRVMRSAHPRLVMAMSKRSECCDWLVAAPNETGPER
jgi:hypothetical protein